MVDDLPYINQISGLASRGIERNRVFLRLLWETGFSRVDRWFDKIPLGSVKRESDPGMRLEQFLTLISEQSHIILQIGSPEPLELRHHVGNQVGGVRTNAFLEMPYTPENFALVEQHYQAAFGTRLQDEPVPPDLIEYYLHRREYYPTLSRFSWT